VPGEVLDDLRTVQANVAGFARRQMESLQSFEAETQPGVFLGQRHLPIAAAGAYVPGGRYPLTASAHMTVVTAKVAGVERVTACTPPDPRAGARGDRRRDAPRRRRRDPAARRGAGVAALSLGTENHGRR
jgi:sulfopropanediol 3-dehydrogenase